MGIYLPNMEMPKDGNETIIRIQPDGTVLDQYRHHLAITAVPVQPHGRLIDADEFFRIFPELISYEFAAPTVIPAEDGE